MDKVTITARLFYSLATLDNGNLIVNCDEVAQVVSPNGQTIFQLSNLTVGASSSNYIYTFQIAQIFPFFSSIITNTVLKLDYNGSTVTQYNLERNLTTTTVRTQQSLLSDLFLDFGHCR